MTSVTVITRRTSCPRNHNGYSLYPAGQCSCSGGASLVVIDGMLTSGVIIAKDPAAADKVDFIAEGSDNTMYAWYKMFERIIENG